MTFPVWIAIGPWRLHPHTVFELLAYASGVTLYLALRRRRGDTISDAHRWSMLTATIVGAAIGSRLLAWFESPAADGVIEAFGGKTIVGGLLGGWIGTELEKLRRGIRQSTGDLYVCPLVVGIAIGRIGCFLSGLPDRTYGTATTLPWAVDFGDGVTRHPTALYESLFVLVLGAALSRLESRLAPGRLFRMFMFAYLAFRVAVDAIKPGLPVALGLTALQWACVIGALYSAWLLSRKEAVVALRATS
jgi:phosphatidylglycerol---prolipoprotein diacylglyceryl transferase